MILNIFSYDMQTGTGIISIPPWIKFRLVSDIAVNFGRTVIFVRKEFCLFFFSFFNIRIFFTITCKKILSSTDSILLHSIKYNLKIHNNEVMNTEREVRTRRWTWIILWAWGRLLMKLQTFTYLQFCSTKRVTEEVLRQRECCELKLKTQTHQSKEFEH